MPLRPPTATPAEKNAKTGMITPLDSGRKRCSRVGARPSRGSSSRMMRGFSLSTGTMKPSSTPAIVAWMPDSYTSHQVTRPMGRRMTHAAQCLSMNQVMYLWVRNQNRASSTAAPIRNGNLTLSVYTNAMIAMAMRSSTTASVSRNVRMATGRDEPTTARTETANAMSVAVGIAQPCSAVGSPPEARLTPRKISAGTSTPPAAATTGRIALRMLCSSPSTNSALSSRPVRKKNTASSPSAAQCPTVCCSPATSPGPTSASRSPK